MTPHKLPGHALRYLRGLGHSLEPVILVGKNGVTETVVLGTKRALLTHELIKVKVLAEAPEGRKETAEALAQASEAALAQVIGRTFLLYKQHPKKPTIVIPKRKTEKKPVI